MRKQIRQSVFETNSSSMHSLTIQGKDMVEFKVKTDELRPWNVSYGEFGWGYDKLNTPEEKLSYLITEYQDDEEMIDMINEALIEYTGSPLSIKIRRNDWYPKGHIDHQSQGMIREYITDKQSIIDIVFNRECTIIIDNDNH